MPRIQRGGGARTGPDHAGHSRRETGKMFGMPSYKVNGKLAVGVFGDGILVKVGAERAAVIGRPGREDLRADARGASGKTGSSSTRRFEQQRALYEEAVRYVAANS